MFYNYLGWCNAKMFNSMQVLHYKAKLWLVCTIKSILSKHCCLFVIILTSPTLHTHILTLHKHIL